MFRLFDMRVQCPFRLCKDAAQDLRSSRKAGEFLIVLLRGGPHGADLLQRKLRAGRKHFHQQGFGKQIPKGSPAIDGPKHENIAGELSDPLLRRR